jgi:predicted DNA-binding ribbon-helix-helix protein
VDFTPAKKRSVVISGRSTSISLEDEFWLALNMLAIAQDISTRECISRIARQRPSTNLSSAVRVAILSYYQGLATGLALATNQTADAAPTYERATDRVSCEIVPIHAAAR